MCEYDKRALAYNSPLNLSARLLVGSTERLVTMDRRLKRLMLLVSGYKSINKKLIAENNKLTDYIEMQNVAIADMHKWYKELKTYDLHINHINETPRDDE